MAEEEFAVEPWVGGWLLEVLYDCAPNIDTALALCERVISPAFAARLQSDIR